MARIKTRAQGTEIACTVIFGWPLDERYFGRIEDALSGFQAGLAAAFGGFTRIEARGAWEGQPELSVLYYFTAHTGEEAERVVDSLLERYGDDLDTQWVHFDKRLVTVAHREIERRSDKGHWAGQSQASPGVEALRQHYAGRWPQQDALTRSEQLRKEHTTPYWEFAIDGGLSGFDFSLVHIWRTVQAHLEAKGRVNVTISHSP